MEKIFFALFVIFVLSCSSLFVYGQEYYHEASQQVSIYRKGQKIIVKAFAENLQGIPFI